MTENHQKPVTAQFHHEQITIPHHLPPDVYIWAYTGYIFWYQ